MLNSNVNFDFSIMKKLWDLAHEQDSKESKIAREATFKTQDIFKIQIFLKTQNTSETQTTSYTQNTNIKTRFDTILQTFPWYYDTIWYDS